MSSGKPTVLFLIDGLQTGGAERSLLELCGRMERFTPVVAVLSNSDGLRSEFERAGIEVYIMSLSRNYRFSRNAARLQSLVSKIQPDIIHSCLFHADMTLRYLRFDGPKVTGLVSNSYSPRRLAQVSWSVAWKINLVKIWDRWTSPRIDFFIANSEVIKKAYTQGLSINPAKIAVIYRGRDITKFGRSKRSTNSPDRLRFISVGRLVASKGYIGLVKAFALLTQQHPAAELTICGEGPERERLEALISLLDMDSKIKLVGTVDDIPTRLETADFFVFPTHYEGLPGALIEAMIAKIPIICSDIPENRECLDESMGLFHRVGDASDLQVQMEKALSLSDWDQRTRRAYDYAAEHFEIGKVVRQYEEVYLHLLSS